MLDANLFMLVAVLLPPRALNLLGQVIDERMVQTPYGDFGPVALRQGAGQPPVWVGPYTGLSTRTDPRATLFAARLLGVQRVLTWEESVALNTTLRRGQTLIVTDYIDWTRHHPSTFFVDKHVHLVSAPVMERRPIRTPFCPQMRAALHHVLPAAPEVIYVGVDGPRRETAAEARMFRLWGGDVVGSNLTPEVGLANELGLCFAGLVTISDLSTDQPAIEPQGEFRAGLEATLQVLPRLLYQLDVPPECDCEQ